MKLPQCKSLSDVDRNFRQFRANELLAFTPTWSAATPPALGNGTLVGYYWREQNTVHYQIRLDMGSTTTYGTGVWTFTLPLSPRVEMDWTGGAMFYDSGTRMYVGKCQINNNDSKLYVYSETAGGASGFVQSNTPFTWASGDVLWMDIAYPI